MARPRTWTVSVSQLPCVIASALELLATIECADKALLPDDVVAAAASMRALVGEFFEVSA